MYEVKWTAIAEQQLAAVWVAAADRPAVNFAVAWLEAALLRYPLLLGDAMESSVHRTAYRAPIGVEYEVIEDDKRVIVQGIFASG